MGRRSHVQLVNDCIIGDIVSEQRKSVSFANGSKLRDYNSLKRRLGDFVITYGFLILEYGDEIKVGRSLLDNLEGRTGMSLNGNGGKVRQILEAHKKELRGIEAEHPFPAKAETLTEGNYGTRRELILSLNENTVKALNEVLA